MVTILKTIVYSVDCIAGELLLSIAKPTSEFYQLFFSIMPKKMICFIAYVCNLYYYKLQSKYLSKTFKLQ